MKSAEIEVINLAEFSGCPALLSGELNALNETIFAGILANSSDAKELNELERFAVKAFDMVVVNLCPFEKLYLKAMMSGR